MDNVPWSGISFEGGKSVKPAGGSLEQGTIRVFGLERSNFQEMYLKNVRIREGVRVVRVVRLCSSIVL